MKLIRIKPFDIAIGYALPWTLYDKHHRMLIKMGEVIHSKEQLDAILDRQPYREETPEDNQPASQDKADKFQHTSPFEYIRDIVFRLKNIFNDLIMNKPGALDHVIKINNEIMELCDWDADASLGALHRYTDLPYTASHPVYISILCELLGKRLNLPYEKRLVIMNAAITSNIGMLELQEKLHKQSAALNEHQKQAIQQHCEKSAEILKATGLEDKEWLDIVYQHHEKSNGGGYPAGLKENEIVLGAKLVALGDRYAAMVSGRAYRKGLPSQQALREVFLKKGEEYSEELSVLLIKELGVYPPGSYVKLKNNEIAVVTHRSSETTTPMVSCIITPEGELYPKPLERDSSQSEYSIKETWSPSIDMHLNLHAIWGYYI